jgi:hypothetical protein
MKTLNPMLGASIDPGHPLADGLVGFWAFNEGAGGRVNDGTGHGYHGSVYNPTSALWKPTPRGLALNCNAASYVRAAPGLTAGLTACTVVLWAQKSSSYGRLVSSYSESAGYGVMMQHHWDNNVRFFVHAASGVAYAISDAPATGAAWRHYAGVYDGSKVVLYLDGIAQASQPAASGAIPSPQRYDFCIGCGLTGSSSPTYGVQPWPGVIEEVALYNRALSAEEIRRLMREPFALFDDDGMPFAPVEVNRRRRILICGAAA